jgi:hypothetical protein
MDVAKDVGAEAAPAAIELTADARAEGRGNSGVVGRHAQRDRGFVMAFGRLGAGDFGRLGLKAIAARLASLLLRDGSSHLLLRNGSGFLLLGH